MQMFPLWHWLRYENFYSLGNYNNQFHQFPSFSFAKPTTLCAYFPFVTLYCKASGQLAASVLRGLTMFQLNVKIFPFSSYMLNELLLNLLLNWVMYSHHISCYKPPMGLLKANQLCVGSYCSPVYYLFQSIYLFQ